MKIKHYFRADSGSNLGGILHFSGSVFISMFVFGVFGGTFGFIYSLVAPSVYEATAQVQMAQILSNSNGVQKWSAIEDPGALIARLSMPTSYTSKEIEACGLGDQSNAITQMVKRIKFIPVRGAPSSVELKVRSGSREGAHVCANAIYELIKSSQADIILPYINEAKTQLENDQKQLYEIRKMILNSAKSGDLAVASYLNIRDEIQYLRDSIVVANKLIIGASNRPSRLAAPIYINATAVSPNAAQLTLFGFFGGVIFGLVMIFLKRKYSEYFGKMHLNLKSFK